MNEEMNNVTVEELVPAEETTEVVEVNDSSAGAVAIGALAATGVIALGYGIYKGIGKLHNKWLDHKARKAAENTVEVSYEEQVQEIHENNDSEIWKH